MISTEQGVYLQFFDDGEAADRELPPLGPFELLIVRHNRIIGDREAVEHDMLGAGSVERWLEAELELRRALGDEPGGVRRNHMRIRAPRGDIIVRFYDYAGDEAPKVPELGPFYSLVIGKREVRADDKLLAIRSTDVAPWTLTDAIRPGIAGINKADFSVFSMSARDPRSAPPVTAPQPPGPAPQPQFAQPAAPAQAPAGAAPTAIVPDTGAAPAETAFVERRKIQREIYVARPQPQQDEQLTPADVNLILKVDKLKQQELAQQLMVERLRREQHVDPETSLRAEASASVPMRFQPPVKERTADEPAAQDNVEIPFTTRVLELLWSARLVLVTVLLLAVAVSAYGYLQPRARASAPPRTFAAVNDKIQTPDWTFTITSVERTRTLNGASPPRSGGFLIVHLTTSRKNADAPALDPSAFTLLDASGAAASALPVSSDVYGPATGLVWVKSYPMGSFVRDHIAFDVNPGTRGVRLLINVANVELRLPDP